MRLRVRDCSTASHYSRWDGRGGGGREGAGRERARETEKEDRKCVRRKRFLSPDTTGGGGGGGKREREISLEVKYEALGW